MPKGTLRAPAACPAANSAGSHTSISIAFSWLIRRTASAGDTAPVPPPLPTMGHSSIAPETTAAKMRIQLLMMKLKGR